MKRQGRLGKYLLLVGVLLSLGVAGSLFPVGVPASSNFQPSIAEIRAFAQRAEGPLPTEIRSLRVAWGSVPRLLVVPGMTLAQNVFTHYTYQVVYPDRFIMIDAVHDDALRQSAGFPGGEVFLEPWTRMQDALRRADAIAITHEHFDHLGGIIQSPHFNEIAGKVVLTEEQVSSKWPVESGMTSTHRDRLKPLRYERMHLLAPGVVLIKAAGHTPGSQMVYVRLQGGAELLLVGDIAWHMDNIRLPRAHPRFTNWIASEDADALVNQLRYLHDLTQSEPSLRIVVAHDGDQMADLVRRGVFLDGLR